MTLQDVAAPVHIPSFCINLWRFCPFDNSAEHSRQIVLFDNKPTSFFDSFKPTFVCSFVGQLLPDDFNRALDVSNINRNDTLFRKIIKHVRASAVERHSVPKKGIRQFLGPVVFSDMIFNGQVKLVSIQRLGLFLDISDTVPKNVEFRQLGFQTLGKIIALRMQCVCLLFGGTNRGDHPSFGTRHCVDNFVIRFTIKPDITSRRTNGVRMGQRPCLLTG